MCGAVRPGGVFSFDHQPLRTLASGAPLPGIIFDFDGVIVDTEPLHERALLQGARSRGLSFTHDEYMTRLIGLADRDCLPVVYALNQRVPSPADLSEYFNEKKRLVHDMLVRGEGKGFPGTLRLIRELSGKVPLAVCSGAVRSEIELVLGLLEVRKHFAAIVSADDVTHSKPHPEGYSKAAATLGLDGSQCIALEDTPTGCRAALAAGVRVIALGHSLPREAFPKEIAAFIESSDSLMPEFVRSIAR